MKIGVDLGGTKIEAIALNDEGDELMRHRVMTPKDNYSQTIQTIVDLIHTIENALDLKGTIGIGTPGSLSLVSHLLRNSNSVCMNGKPVKGDLEKLLQRNIRMSNDANCFALSEATDGAGADAEVVFAVIVGTGTGAGVVVNGKVLNGVNAIAGEWGHNPLPWPMDEERPGPDCYCGKKGCIETFLSGPAIEQDYFHISGKQHQAKDIALLAEQGDTQAELCLARYENRMARSLSHVINILDPDVIVLGGGMSNIQRLYDNVPKLWAQYVFSDHVATKLLPPRYGDSSGVRGAAWLWDDL